MKQLWERFLIGVRGSLPDSVRSRVFIYIFLCALTCFLASLLLPALLLFPVFLVAVYLILARMMGRPLVQLLQLTRHNGFDLMGRSPVVTGRDEYARLARGMYAMANRMRDSLVEARDQNTRLDEIFNAIGEGVIIVDPEGRVLKMNHTAERWTGWYGDAAGKPLTEITRSVELSDSVAAMVKKYRNTSDERLLEPTLLEALTLEGPESKVVRAKVVALPRDDRSLTVMIFLFDVSDLHRLQEIRREFFANVSHELKTPISAIRGYAETLLDVPGVQNDELAHKFTQVILRNTLDLTKLIDEMLTLSGLESGSLPLHIRSYDIRGALQRVVETTAPKAKEAQVELIVDVAKDVGDVFADPQRFDSVLLNLVDNGIKYNRAGGFVKISVRQAENEHLIFVEDSGQGIPDSAKPRAFERFYRVDKAHSRLGGGSGLGLAIVKHVVLAHGGQITLRSESGVGTVFTISLPKRLATEKVKRIESVMPV